MHRPSRFRFLHSCQEFLVYIVIMTSFLGGFVLVTAV